MATAADSTHPTGMHPFFTDQGLCLRIVLLLYEPIMVRLYCPTPRPRPRLREWGSIIMCGNVFTAPTLRPMQISTGFCTHFIGLGLGLGLGVRQCK